MTPVSNLERAARSFVSNDVDAANPPKPAVQDAVVREAHPNSIPLPAPSPIAPAPTAPSAVTAPVVRTGHDYWQPVAYSRSLTLHDHVGTLSFNGRLLVSTDRTLFDGTMALWDVATGDLEATFEDRPMENGTVQGPWVAVHVRGERLSPDAEIKVVSHETGQLRASFACGGCTTFRFLDDDRIIHTDAEGICISNINTGMCERRLPVASDANPTEFAVNHDTIAAALSDGTVALWSMDGRLRAQYKAHEDGALCIAFSARDVVSGGADGDVVIANRYTGEIKRRFKAMDDGVDFVAFTKHSVVTAASNAEGVSVWDRRGNLLQTIKDPEGTIWPVQVVSNTVVGATESGEIKIWEPGKKGLTQQP